jgi:TPR repeat protein
MYGIGVAHARGIGVKQDAAEAVRWLHIAANNGNVFAMYWIGVAYRNGEGLLAVPRIATPPDNGWRKLPQPHMWLGA